MINYFALFNLRPFWQFVAFVCYVLCEICNEFIESIEREHLIEENPKTK